MRRYRSSDLATLTGQDVAAPRESSQKGGRRAQQIGNLAAKTFGHIHEGYRIQSRAVIHPANIPTATFFLTQAERARIGRHVPPVLRQQTGKAPYDYHGALRGGQAVYVELKATAERGTSMPVSAAGIDMEQIDALLAFDAIGALVAAVWANGLMDLQAGQVGVLLAAGLRDARRMVMAGERKSIPADRFTWLEPGDRDWLAVVEKHIEQESAS